MYNSKMVAMGKSRSAIRELSEYGNALAEKLGRDKVFDFTIGNPSVPTPKKVNATIVDKVQNDGEIHTYTSSQGLLSVRQKIADFNKKRYGMPLSAQRIYMTCGAAAALAIALRAVVTESQNQVVVLAPYFPEYKVFAENANAEVLVVPFDENGFQIDFEALAATLTAQTAAVIVNSPNNPSGIVYSKQTLEKLARVLKSAEERLGTTIVLISDEPYREIVFDVPFESPLTYFDDCVLCYSYSKTFSLPGERIGFVAVSDRLKNADELYCAILGAGRSLGYVCAPKLFQKVVEECVEEPTETLPYRENRDMLVAALQREGFCVVNPQGAFYLLAKAPDGNSQRFSEEAKKLNLLIVPTDSFGLVGYARVATCVSQKTVTDSLPAWHRLAKIYFEK